MGLKRKVIFNIYISSLPFSHAFSYYNGLITLTLLISLVMLLDIVLASRWKVSFRLLWYLAPALIFIFYVALNGLLNAQPYGSYVKHVISYLASPLLFLIVPMVYIDSFKLKYTINNLMFWITFMVFFTCLYACCQFIFNNFYGVNLDDFLYWPTEKISNTMALSSYFRTKGFFAEPGHFALFLECFIPIIFWFFYRKNIALSSMLKNIIFLIIVSAFVLTISAAGFACITLGAVIALGFNINSWNKYSLMPKRKSLLILAVVFGVGYYTNDYFSVFDIVYTNSIDKLDSGSSHDRLKRWEVVMDIVNNMNIIDYIIGHGPNATVSLGYPAELTILLLFPLLFVELGAIGILLFLSIVSVFLFKSVSIHGNVRFYVQASLISVLLHYVFISNYWYPYLWFLGILIYLVRKLEYDNNANNNNQYLNYDTGKGV